MVSSGVTMSSYKIIAWTLEAALSSDSDALDAEHSEAGVVPAGPDTAEGRYVDADTEVSLSTRLTIGLRIGPTDGTSTGEVILSRRTAIN